RPVLRSFPTRRSSDLCGHGNPSLSVWRRASSVWGSGGLHAKRPTPHAQPLQITLASFLSLSTRAATSATLMPAPRLAGSATFRRSEEHTSELQSRENL